MLFDTHAHLNDPAFDPDREELMEGLAEKGIGLVMNAGCSLESSRDILRMAETYPWLYASAGSHPDSADEVNEAVLEEKGEKIPEKVECTVTLRCDAFISERYVPYAAQRMGLYKKIAMIESPEDRDDILDELIDRYGDVPKPTQTLLMVALVRSAAMRCGITTIIEEQSEIRITPSVFDFEVWSELSEEYRGRLRVIMSEHPTVAFRKQKDDDVTAILYRLFCRYEEILKKYL